VLYRPQNLLESEPACVDNHRLIVIPIGAGELLHALNRQIFCGMIVGPTQESSARPGPPDRNMETQIAWGAVEGISARSVNML
jgi:hypothetical protein